jgi:preprotein translocase subunit SecG
MFGGGLGASAAGSTVVEKNLDRLTVVAGVIFTFTSIALALLIDN